MRKMRIICSFLLLAGLLTLLAVLNVCIGTVSVEPASIVSILTGKLSDPTAAQIIWNIRLPRLTAAAILGGGLAVSGLLLQTFFANPIAGPFVLGISSGAKLAVALTMIFLLGRGLVIGSWGMILAAFCGAMLSMGFILLLSGKVKSMSLLVVGGVMVGYICSSVTDILVTFADDSNIVNLHNWALGSFSGMTWENVRILRFVTIAAFLAALFLSKPMDAYQLGEGYAENLGVNVKGLRVLLILLSSLLSACVTAFAGPISFVGIAVPHLMKGLFRTSKMLILLPACYLGGGVFCLLCDLLARVLFAPTELSISSVTAVFGAPIVIYMMVRKK